MYIVNWMIKSNTDKEHWWRKLLFHLWIFYFCCNWQKRSERMILLEFDWLPSDQTLCVWLSSCSAGARRRTGFGGLGCLCWWQEQVKEQTEILLWACMSCAHLRARIMDFFVCWFSKCLKGHSQLLVAQSDLWFLLIPFLWMWHLLALCLS